MFIMIIQCLCIFKASLSEECTYSQDQKYKSLVQVDDLNVMPGSSVPIAQLRVSFLPYSTRMP